MEDERDEGGRTKLHYAVVDGKVDEVESLLEDGFDVNARDKQGITPLHAAAIYQRTEIARMLIEAGTEIDAKDGWGNTPLFRAVYYRESRDDLIPLLRKREADPFAVNNYGVSPVSLAREIASHDVAQFFRDLPEGSESV